MNVFDIKIKQERNGLVYLPNETTPFTGVFAGWHQNSQTSSEEYYKNGKLDGKCTEWYRDGQTSSEEHYKNGKLDGKCTEWYRDGQTSSEEHYKNGKLDGKCTKWYGNSQTSSEEYYKNGKLDGKCTEWHENGQKRTEGSYTDKIPESTRIPWINGTDQTYNFEGRFFIFGYYFEHPTDSIQRDRFQLKNQRWGRDGKWVRWHDNGQKSSEEYYKDGMGDGKWVFWDESGYKISEIGYKDGARDGKWFVTHPRSTGESDSWCEDQDLLPPTITPSFSIESNYKNGKLDGKYTKWSYNGQLIEESNYKNGKLDGKYTKWSYNGQLIEESNYKNGKLDGKYTKWSYNGQLIEESNYKNGKLDGKYTKWYFVIFVVVIIFFLN